MKNLKPKTLMSVCCILLAAVLSGCGASQPDKAAEVPESAKALSAYSEILKAAPAINGEHAQLGDASFSREQNLELFGKHYELFALFDINCDGISELIALSTVNFRWTDVYVYTYANGEAVLLKDSSGNGEPCSFAQISSANGAYTTYFCAENHIHSLWRGTTPAGEAAEENIAYAIDGSSLTAAVCTAGENENTVFFEDIAKANTAENADAMLH